jgi:hypothetical protein
MSRKVLAGALIYPMERAREVLEFYGEFSVIAPDELNIDLVLGYPAQNTRGFVALAPCYCGDPGKADSVMAAFKKLGKPIAGEIKPTDYVALQRSNDNDAPRSTATYLKGGFTSEISQKLINTLVDGLEPHPDRSVIVIFQQAGGAIKRVSANATAFAHRYAEHNMMVTMGWKPDSPPEAHVAAIKGYWKTLIPFTHGFYSNEADDDNAGLINKNYQGNYARLLEIKRRYDPDNMFRLNANIDPGTSS